MSYCLALLYVFIMHEIFYVTSKLINVIRKCHVESKCHANASKWYFCLPTAVHFIPIVVLFIVGTHFFHVTFVVSIVFAVVIMVTVVIVITSLLLLLIIILLITYENVSTRVT